LQSLQGDELNINCPADHLMLRARLEARSRGVPHAVAIKIQELSDCGLDVFEIAAHLGIPRPLVVLVLRGAPPGVVK
jgi:hypothetical protein